MKAPRKRRPTTDAVEILHRRYFEGKPARLAALEEERANAEIARKIYELRTKAELTQQQLARLVGTSTSVICRLEDADYEGHSLSMLRRIATALNKDGLCPLRAKGELLEHGAPSSSESTIPWTLSRRCANSATPPLRMANTRIALVVQ